MPLIHKGYTRMETGLNTSERIYAEYYDSEQEAQEASARMERGRVLETSKDIWRAYCPSDRKAGA